MLLQCCCGERRWETFINIWSFCPTLCELLHFTLKNSELLSFLILQMKNCDLVTCPCSCYREKLELDQHCYFPQNYSALYTRAYIIWLNLFSFSLHLIFPTLSTVHVLMLSCQTACSPCNSLFLILLSLFLCCFLCLKYCSLSYLPKKYVFTFYDSIPSLNTFVRIWLSVHC